MSHPERPYTVSPRGLQEEANRLVQTASPEQQGLTVKLMTPLMSDTEGNVSCVRYQAPHSSNQVRSLRHHQAKGLRDLWSLFSAWHISMKRNMAISNHHGNRILARIQSLQLRPIAGKVKVLSHPYLIFQVIDLHLYQPGLSN
jgi:hypothetical protein